jgi:hypothetical protein
MGTEAHTWKFRRDVPKIQDAMPGQYSTPREAGESTACAAGQAPVYIEMGRALGLGQSVAWHSAQRRHRHMCICISLTSAMKNRMFGSAGAPWPNDESESAGWAAGCEAGGVVVARGPCWSEVTNTTRHSRAGRCTCPTDTAIDGLGTVSCNAHCAVLHRPSVHKCKCVWIWGTQFTPCKPITVLSCDVTSLSLSHV